MDDNIKKALDIIEDCVWAMEGYQKASGSDRSDWDFIEEIETAQNFVITNGKEYEEMKGKIKKMEAHIELLSGLSNKYLAAASGLSNEKNRILARRELEDVLSCAWLD